MSADSMHLVCPHCAAINRVPAARLAEGPDCGRCHRPIFTGRPIALDEAGFDRHLTRADLPLLVDFWAPWCGPCRMMAPAYEEAAALLEPRVRVAKVDTDAQTQLGARFAIRSIPTLALFHGGREIGRQAGALNRGAILDWVSSRL